jgi:hypothetical protein
MYILFTVLVTIWIYMSVEATQLNERCFRLKPQDAFLRENIGKDDILIVSVGGNDIARRPTLCTIAAMTGLLCLPTSCVQGGCSYCALPVSNLYCTFIHWLKRIPITYIHENFRSMIAAVDAELPFYHAQVHVHHVWVTFDMSSTKGLQNI